METDTLPRAGGLRPARFALLLLLFGGAAHADDPVEPLELTLAQAVDETLTRNPALTSARLAVDEARGALVGARIPLRYNPEISLAPDLADVGGPSPGVEAEVRQRLEIAGQRGARLRTARAGVAFAEAEFVDDVRLRLLAVVVAFYEALAAEEREAVLARDARLAEDLFEVARVRVEAGADAPVHEATARIRLAEARRAHLASEAETKAARVRLAAIVGLPDHAAVDPVGSLPEAPIAAPEVEDLVVTALSERPDLEALRRAETRAEAELRLARRSAWPDLVAGVRREAFDGTPQTLGVVGLTVPLFDRNQGERAAATARLGRREAEVAAGEIEVEAEVLAAAIRLDAAGRALALYDAEVLSAQDESVVLLTRMFEAGKVGYADVVALQRERLVGAVGYVDARFDYARAESELRAAAGLPLDVTPSDAGVE